MVRFSTRTDLVDIKTGEVIDAIKVKYLTTPIYYKTHGKLFLKDVLGNMISIGL